jgi:hypothetical protein
VLALLTVLSLALECYIAVVAAVTHTRKKKTQVGSSYHHWGEGGVVWVTLQLLTSTCKKTLRQQCMLWPHLAVKTKPIVNIDMERLLRLEHRIHTRESSGPNQLQGLETRGI